MKNLKQLLSFIVITCVVIIVFLTTSCKQPNPICSSCKLLPADDTVNIKILSNDYLVKYWNDTISSDRYYRIGMGEASSEQLKEVVDWINLPKESIPVSVVLYVNKFVANGVTVSGEDILGCQYYYVVGDILMHKFYFMDKGKLVNIKSLTGQTSGINYNNRFDLYRIYFANKFPKVFAFGLTDVSVPYREPSFNEVNALVQYLLNATFNKAAYKTTLPPGGSKCGRPCADIHSTRSCVQKGAMPASCDDKHDDTDDPSVAMSTSSVSSGYLTQQDADITFNLPLQYLFRDSFMNKYNYTQKYIAYYYGLSKFHYLTPAIIKQSIIVLNLFNSRMNWLLSPRIYGDHVLINDQFKTEAMILINLMIVAAPNSREVNYLTEAKHDLSTYQNLTVRQFLSQLN
jgi:hypothetical protein